jgi:hypothetical protein
MNFLLGCAVILVLTWPFLSRLYRWYDRTITRYPLRVKALWARCKEWYRGR